MEKTRFQELKQEILRKLSLNRIAYLGNSKLNEDWSKGYNQAIQDLERYLVTREVYYK